jgi:Holliday junction resolvase RusA-like endonuclease
MEELTFIVTGKPEPGGSKTGFVHPHTQHVVVVDANKKLKPWQGEVKRQVLEQLGGTPLLLDGPIDLTLRFYLARPKSHFGSGANALKVLDSAPARPTVRPDVLKLSRGVEDALTEIVWKDDAQIVNEYLEKHYGYPERVEILVKPVAQTTAQVDGQLALAA